MFKMFDNVTILQIQIMFWQITRPNLVKDHLDYADKVMHAHNIITVRIKDEALGNLNIGKFPLIIYTV